MSSGGCLECTGLAVGRLSQNSILQNTKQASSVCVLAFVNCEVHTMLGTGTELAGCRTLAGCKEIISEL